MTCLAAIERADFTRACPTLGRNRTFTVSFQPRPVVRPMTGKSRRSGRLRLTEVAGRKHEHLVRTIRRHPKSMQGIEVAMPLMPLDDHKSNLGSVFSKIDDAFRCGEQDHWIIPSDILTGDTPPGFNLEAFMQGPVPLS